MKPQIIGDCNIVEKWLSSMMLVEILGALRDNFILSYVYCTHTLNRHVCSQRDQIWARTSSQRQHEYHHVAQYLQAMMVQMLL